MNIRNVYQSFALFIAFEMFCNKRTKIREIEREREILIMDPLSKIKKKKTHWRIKYKAMEQQSGIMNDLYFIQGV